jgi:3-oxoacyl-[acyl-carrier-protein] synthase-3
MGDEMTWSRIAGTGSALPAKCVSNDDLARQMDTSDEWIRTRTGIRQRYIAAPEQTSSDLGAEAARAALDAARMSASDIDLIVVATSTPDFIFPSTACLIQRKIGAKGCPAFDVQAVCSGFVYAMSVADKFIRTGSAKSALVIGAEVFSRILDWNDRGTAVLFGDGAGAVVLKADTRPGILASALHADGNYSDILCVPGNVSRGEITGTPFLKMDGQAVFKFAVRVLDEVARETLAQCQLTPADVDWMIPHQANVRILEATAKRLGLPKEKVITTVGLHANTSAASVPLALDLGIRDGRIKPGQKLLLEGVGGGFAWGAVLAEY